jgi:hypothetical protein
MNPLKGKSRILITGHLYLLILTGATLLTITGHLTNTLIIISRN